MRIALDYTTGIYPGAGVARYTRSLVRALAAIDGRNQYRLFYAARGLPRPTPETAQAALRLRFVEDLDYEGIAGRLGVSPAAARQRVSTAVRTLRERHAA